MHFCPRPSCRRFYHRSCLNENGHNDPDPSTRTDRLLTCSPDTDDEFTLKSLMPSRNIISRFISSSQREPLDDIPDQLINIANFPIVRGHNCGGVAGNVKVVVTARRMIYHAIEAGGFVPNDWEETFKSMAYSAIKGPIPALLCPECRGPI